MKKTKNLERLIEETLYLNNIGIDRDNSVLEALEKLLIYHEELKFQNDELKRANTLIEKIQKSYESLFQEAPVPYFLLDENMNINKFNKAGVKLLESSDLVGQPIAKFIAPDFQDKFYYLKRKMVSGEEYSVEVDLLIAGDTKHVKILANIVDLSDEIFSRFTIIDQTYLRQQMDKVSYLSFHDQLTGVYNRHYLMEELTRLDQQHNYPIGMLMVDVNGLKLVNDTFGHHIGDQLLIEAGKLLANKIRDGDTLARIGGDEFVLVFPKIKELEIKQIIKRMKLSSEKIKVEDIKLSIAYGYAIKNSKEQSLHQVLRDAEDKMYKDKLFNRTSLRKDIINSILATLYEKYSGEEEHSKRVSDYAVMVARELACTDENILNLRTAGILHDIGKVAIDHSIINKTEPLSEADYEEIKKHPSIGYRIISSSGIFEEVLEIILSHHERVDGKGYPRKLKGVEISREAKILSVCEAYDAMTSDHSYRKAMSKESAIEELIKGKNTQFDADIVDKFISALSRESKNLIENF